MKESLWQPGLEIIFSNLPVKMTSIIEFVSVIKENVLVILLVFKKIYTVQANKVKFIGYISSQFLNNIKQFND